MNTPTKPKYPPLACPYDTDGDGNCGQRYCPFCSPQQAIAEQRRRAECFDDLLNALKRRIKNDVSWSPNAVHHSGLFCRMCGLNDLHAVHATNCPTLAAELAIAKAEGRTA